LLLVVLTLLLMLLHLMHGEDSSIEMSAFNAFDEKKSGKRRNMTVSRWIGFVKGDDPLDDGLVFRYIYNGACRPACDGAAHANGVKRTCSAAHIE
jgi:hypothetical protein